MAVDWLPEPGEILDERYRLGDQIGVGPTGAVYAATRLLDDHPVVVKVFHPELFEGQVRGPNSMRLQRARLMRAPGLVTLEEIDVREGSAFVVMPRIESLTLADWLEANGPLDLGRIVELTQTVGLTLETIHQLGVHGDVKPSNLYVSAAGDVLLSDPWFLEGLAGIRDAAGLAPRADAWLAPEQMSGTWQERPETDIYRLAMLIGWLLNGGVVEGGSSLVEQGVSVPESLDAVFVRATQVEPGERFGQVRDFLDALCAVELPDEASPEGSGEVADRQEVTADPLGSTTDSDYGSALEVGVTMTQGAEVLRGYPPIAMTEDPADETLEDASPKVLDQEDPPGGEDELVEDPAATSVLRPGAAVEEPVDLEASEAAPSGALTEESEGQHFERTPIEEVGDAPDDQMGPALDSLIHEEAAGERRSVEPDKVEDNGPLRDETERDVPGAVESLTASMAVGSAHETDGGEDEPLSNTRKQVAPERDASWRTNPIMLIGPVMFVLSLFVALMVLDTVQDRRHTAAAIAPPLLDSPTKTSAPTLQRASQQTGPGATGSTAAAPPNEPPAGVAQTRAEAGAPSKPPAAAPPEPGTVEDPLVKPATPDEADSESPGETGYRSLQCPANMIRVRRASKSQRGRGSSEMEVWCIDRYEFPGKGRTPRAGVGVVKAERLCAERGQRLCTRREWSVACGGKYPYKGEFDPDACNSAAPGPTPRSVKPSGSKLRCVSGWGAYDMVGNVAEWTSDGKVNGGGARGDAEGGTCYRSVPRKSGASDVGFRCCAEPSRTETQE